MIITTIIITMVAGDTDILTDIRLIMIIPTHCITVIRIFTALITARTDIIVATGILPTDTATIVFGITIITEAIMPDFMTDITQIITTGILITDPTDHHLTDTAREPTEPMRIVPEEIEAM